MYKRTSSRMSCIAVVGFMIVVAVALAAQAPDGAPGEFEGHSDIGAVKRPGAAEYDPQTGRYVLEGSGANMWFQADEGHFLWKKLKGDFILDARIAFIGKGVEAHRKIGWMVRPTLDGGSAHASAVVHGDGLTSLQFRKAAGSDTEEVKLDITGPDEIRLERRVSTFIMSAARHGDLFTSGSVPDLALGDEVYVGLFVCSHNADVSEKAFFGNVRVTVPAPSGFVPYQDYIGSRLEVLDVDSGARTVVRTAPGSIQAPNWTTDGKALIYNAGGLLYKFDLATGKPAALDTDFARSNNNDHALSFDGKRLGISNHSAADGGESVIYVLPSEGGKPVRVTVKAPSYLHGWSPDGKDLVYTGGRNDKFDVYRIAVTGGPETRLTDAEGLDDGPEYTPDGRFIYFNSNRTGPMQIWRMRPDGRGQEQVTFGELQDWFPHVSPDGRRIVFLSFSRDVPSDDHPFYKPVYIRMMPAGGGEPRVIAYVYGGQGTINVPSWSPDGTRIAFVSNTRF
jgi:TolB protein